ncbi:hypothetical protein GCM10010436_54110 [Paractinoplanes durhamensis]
MCDLASAGPCFNPSMMLAGRRIPTQRMPWLAPGAVLRRLAEMRAAGGHRAAEMLLDAIGANRAPHEVAAILEALSEAGDTPDADRVLTTACRRPSTEVAAMLAALPPARRATFLTHARDASQVVAVTALLDPADSDALLDAAVARPARADSEVPSPARPAEADDVRGWPACTAGLVTALREAGRGEQARQLAGRVAAGCRDVPEFLELIGAIPVDDVLATVAARRAPDEVAAIAAHLETSGAEAAGLLARAVLAEGAATIAAVLARLDETGQAAALRRILQRLAATPAGVVVQVMAELVRADRRALSRAVATAVPAGAQWPARVLIDQVVASPAHAARLAGLADPGRFAAELVAEPAGVVAAVLTRASAAEAAAVVDAILDELARGTGTVKWIARLWHLDPEPAASAGHRPDLVDRFLGLVVQHRSPRQVADLIRELDTGDGGPIAARIVRLLLDDPGRRWARPYVGHLLGDSPRAADLCGDWTGDRTTLARAAAVDELRRLLPEPDPADGWQPTLTLRPDERPLWLIRLGDLEAGSLIGLSDRGVHCHSAPRPPGPQSPREFHVDYEQFAQLTFAFAEDAQRIRIGKEDSFYYWAAGNAADAEARAVTALLNQVAAAVRAICAVRLDEPLGPSASGWFTAAGV